MTPAAPHRRRFGRRATFAALFGLAVGPLGAVIAPAPLHRITAASAEMPTTGSGRPLDVTSTASAPPNDDFAGAIDLSALPIPAYVAGANGRPVNTAPVVGTTVGSTREALEYGTTVNPDGSESPPPNGTVWYRYTAPVNGFSGRLGLQVTPGFIAAPLTPAAGLAGPPTGRHDAVQYAPGNTWPPSSIQFVRMEPGHTVWFQVQATFVSDQPPMWNDGEFTLELFQAPNEQDDIRNAYDVNSGNPWGSPFNWYGDGDTYHTTPDQPNGPATMWFTATFAQAGTWSFMVTAEGAARQPSTRPLGLRLYRAPSLATVSDPSTLALVTGSAGAVDPDGPFATGVPQWVTRLADVPVQPGRYYWSVDQGTAGPTFFDLRSSFTAGVVVDTTPPDTVIDSATVVGRDLTVTFSGTDDRPGGVRFECALGPEAGFDLASVTWGPCSSPAVYTNLAGGRYVIAVRAVDAAGNVDPSPALRTAVIAPPITTLSIADKSIVEGNRGIRYLGFQVTLSSPSTQVVVARYATQSGTARRYSDYWPASGTVVLQPGQLTATVQVAIIGDRIVEPHEWFTMRLSAVSGAALGRALAVGTILNDDGRRVAGRIAPR